MGGAPNHSPVLGSHPPSRSKILHVDSLVFFQDLSPGCSWQFPPQKKQPNHCTGFGQKDFPGWLVGNFPKNPSCPTKTTNCKLSMDFFPKYQKTTAGCFGKKFILESPKVMEIRPWLFVAILPQKTPNYQKPLPRFRKKDLGLVSGHSPKKPNCPTKTTSCKLSIGFLPNP